VIEEARTGASLSGSSSTLVVMFAASGFSGLVYETLWAQYLRMLVGSAAVAQSLVLAVFLGGMGLGAWWVSRRTDGWGNLLRRYAWAEAALGILAFVFHPVFMVTSGLLFDRVIPSTDSAVVTQVAPWALAVLLVLGQSVLLGMTFPLMTGAMARRRPAEPGASVAVLYFANTLGGAVGVLSAGFLLVGMVGLPGTMLFGGAINLVVARMAWRYSTHADAPGAPPPEAPGLTTDTTRPRLRRSVPVGLLVAVATFTGLASLAYEIVWIRMLSMLLGSTTHAFELMLSAFLIGLAFGGLWIRSRIDELKDPATSLGLIQVLMGLLAVATLPLYVRLFGVMQSLTSSLEQSVDGYQLFNLASYGMALTVMLPATLLAGMTLPLVTVLLMRSGWGERAIGRAYSFNTVGAVVGALVAIHLGLPLLGLKWTLGTAALLDIAVGTAVLLAATTGVSQIRWGVASVALCAATVAVLSVSWLDPLLLASGVFSRGVDLAETSRREVVAHGDGPTASVALVRDPQGVLTLRTNGKPSASVAAGEASHATSDETVSTLLGVLPLALKPEARSAANVGLGSGLTTHVLLGSPTIDQVTTIEIEPMVVAAAPGFLPRNRRALSDPRSRIVRDDARRFFARSGPPFDIIVTQPSNSWVDGAASLYSLEFYRAAARRLADDGVFVQWVELIGADPRVVTSILGAMASVFPHFAVYSGTGGDMLVAASLSAPLPVPDEATLALPKLTEDLRAVDILNEQDLAIRFTGDETVFRPAIDLVAAPVNSEFRPFVEQSAAQANFVGASAEELLHLYLQPLPVMELLGLTRRAWTHSEVTTTPAFFYTSRTHTAQEFRDQVAALQDTTAEAERTLATLRGDAWSLRHECSIAPSEAEALSALYAIGIAVIADLTPVELERIWTGLESLSCVEELDDVGRQWLALLQAVGRRDRQTILEHVPSLLDDANLTQARARYLLFAGMTAELGSGRPEAALALWNRERGRLYRQVRPPFFFRHLAEVAASLAPRGSTPN
jgi:predicted membrane-bound spermidine synthase